MTSAVWCNSFVSVSSHVETLPSKDWHLKTYILKYRPWQNRMNRLQPSEVFSNRPKYMQCSVLQTTEKICLFMAFLWQFPTWNWYSSRQAHFYPNKCIIVNRSTTPPCCIKTNNCQKECIQAIEATQSIFCKMTTPTVKPNPLSSKEEPGIQHSQLYHTLQLKRNFFLDDLEIILTHISSFLLELPQADIFSLSFTLQSPPGEWPYFLFTNIFL